jgi:threonine 3-dehydrogenase
VGAARVVVVGASTARLALAARMRAHRTVDARTEDVAAALAEESGGEGMDVVLEMSGAAKAIAGGLAALRKGGTFVAFGLSSGDVSIDYNDGVVFREARVIGINGRRMFETWYQTKALLETGLVDPTPVITHAFPLDQFGKAFELLDDPASPAGKVVLLPE